MKSKLFLLMVQFIFVPQTSLLAQMQEGVIVYERKCNLFKLYTDRETQEYIGQKNKYMTENFQLHFNDSISVYQYDENIPLNANYSWTTMRNTTIILHKQQVMQRLLNVYGTNYPIKDSVPVRTWKYTDRTRTICNIECNEAVYEYNDSIRIYAWFTPTIRTEIGPESYCNLPGGILGLALEDGSVTIFAKSIEEKRVNMREVVPKFNEKKVKVLNELIERYQAEKKDNTDIDQLLLQLLIW